MEKELLSIKWNDHRNTFFDVLATAREKKTFCDATIVCEGNFYHVHRFILSTCSTYFERILEDIKETHPVILLTGINPKDIEALLQYMYTGEIKILQEDISSLIKSGEVLKIKGIGVADTNEKCIKSKRYCNDSEEIPTKRRRSNELTESSRLNESHVKLKNNVQKELHDCNKDNNQKEINGSTGPSNQLTSEFLTIKEEIFQPIEEVILDSEQNVKAKLNKSLMDEEVLLASRDEVDRTSHSFKEEDYENLASNQFHDASTSSILPDQNIHMDWIIENEFQGVTKETSKVPLTGWCLVCQDRSSGYHYGIETCEGCNAFFKRGIRNNVGMTYQCYLGGGCDIRRLESLSASEKKKTCKACRFNKCIMAGMNCKNVRKP